MKRTRTYSPTVNSVAQLLGAQVRQARIERKWTVRDLADRAQISPGTLLKVEHGVPSVALGTAVDVAVLVGVPLFFEDRRRLATEATREQERARFLAQRVRPPASEPDYDF